MSPVSPSPAAAPALDSPWSPERVAVLRALLGWSRIELAARLHVSTKSIARWERGETRPHPVHVHQLDQLERAMYEAATLTLRQQFAYQSSGMSYDGGHAWRAHQLTQDPP